MFVDSILRKGRSARRKNNKCCCMCDVGLETSWRLLPRFRTRESLRRYAHGKVFSRNHESFRKIMQLSENKLPPQKHLSAPAKNVRPRNFDMASRTWAPLGDGAGVASQTTLLTIYPGVNALNRQHSWGILFAPRCTLGQWQYKQRLVTI